MPAAKRKAAEDDYVPAKRPRTSTDPHSAAKALTQKIIADEDNFILPIDADDEDHIRTREAFIYLAKYAQHLEGAVNQAQSATQKVSAPAAPPPAQKKSPEQIADLVSKMQRTAVSGIKKQMGWKPSCKTGGAKWTYDGLCADPEIFGAFMRLPGPPKFKLTKIGIEEFEDIVGDTIHASIRYGRLRITSTQISVKWNPTEGEFKFSGTYGL